MATLAILNHELQARGVYDSFWNFILSNESGVIGTAAGVTLGIATAALAYVSIVGLIVPALAYSTTMPLRFVSKRWGGRLTAILYGDKKPQFDIARVWYMTLMWVLVVGIVFIVLEGLRHLANRNAVHVNNKTKKDQHTQ